MKQLLKALYVDLVNKKQHEPIVICSAGRSGSTLLSQCIREAVAQSNILLSNRMLTSGLWDKNTAPEHMFVYKSHLNFNDIRWSRKAKIIYVYDDIHQILGSTYNMAIKNRDWWLSHQRHFGLETSDQVIDDIFDYDCLKLCENIRSYYETNMPVLFIHFDEIWNATDVIENFLNLKIRTPQKRKRIKYDAKFHINAYQEYTEIVEKIQRS